jgi:hypothetical protein
MKKLMIILTLMVGFCICVCACAKVEVEPEPTTDSIYTADGRYYIDGTVITEDGNVWEYHTNNISNEMPYDYMPVWVAFDNNGTDDITDDVILGLVHDKITALYDTLEERGDDNVY